MGEKKLDLRKSDVLVWTNNYVGANNYLEVIKFVPKE